MTTRHRYSTITYTIPADTPGGTLFKTDNLDLSADGFNRCDGVAFVAKETASFSVSLSGSKDGSIIDESPVELYTPQSTPVNERFLALGTDTAGQQYTLRVKALAEIGEETTVKVIFRLKTA